MAGKPEIWALLGTCVWLTLFWHAPFINDVAWQLWVGRQLNDGAQLYVDILEVNPPLWFWFGALIQHASEIIGLGGRQVLLLAFGTAACVTFYLCRQLVADATQRTLLYASVIVALFLSSPYALGQREQFVLIVIVPYVTLIARRAGGSSVPIALSVAVAVWAACGLALKHYFVLVPLGLEAWLMWRTGKVRLRPEVVALVCAAGAYGAAIISLSPDYLRTMVPLIQLAYDGYDVSLADQLRQPSLFAALFAIAAVIIRGPRTPMLGQAAAVAAAAFAFVYLLQGKGFHYHAAPALGMGILAVLVGFAMPPRARLQPPYIIAAALAAAAAVFTPFSAGPARFDQAASAATSTLSPGSPIIVLSASGVAAWPTVEERRLGWPSRHMTLWMLPSVWLSMQRGEKNSALALLADRVRLEVARDIACARPALVLVDSRYDEFTPQNDVLAYMSAEPAFARVVQAYERRPDSGYLRVYRRRAVADEPRRGARLCSRRDPAQHTKHLTGNSNI